MFHCTIWRFETTLDLHLSKRFLSLNCIIRAHWLVWLVSRTFWSLTARLVVHIRRLISDLVVFVLIVLGGFGFWNYRCSSFRRTHDVIYGGFHNNFNFWRHIAIAKFSGFIAKLADSSFALTIYTVISRNYGFPSISANPTHTQLVRMINLCGSMRDLPPLFHLLSSSHHLHSSSSIHKQRALCHDFGCARSRRVFHHLTVQCLSSVLRARVKPFDTSRYSTRLF